jgi:hypothetical protein
LKIQLSVTLYLLIILFIACDPDLFKPKDESPEVGNIQSSLSEIFVGDTVKFWVIATDPDGGTLNYIWNSNGGDFITSHEEDSVMWRAPFQGGKYFVQVNVANKNKSVTKEKQVDVTSLNKPVVRILSPLDQQYLVQYETTKIEAEAFHENNILYVEFFVNDSSIKILSGKQTNIYSMDWIIGNNVGATEIKVSATATTTNADSIIVNIEGVIPGKR